MRVFFLYYTRDWHYILICFPCRTVNQSTGVFIRLQQTHISLLCKYIEWHSNAKMSLLLVNFEKPILIVIIHVPVATNSNWKVQFKVHQNEKCQRNTILIIQNERNKRRKKLYKFSLVQHLWCCLCKETG